ncbi:ATP-binding protein [Streptomyces sp. NBC_00882]|uniref:ATP-binding protein n=1 Tax=Streptomyces sp. NBC_00882 TaxID=2975856 RepID=UPI00387054D0|nr:ATP-binding protein [Streptomyces sp. NBC_00882]
MSADDVTPIPLLASSVRLNAIPQAVAATRLFVRHTLTLWSLEEHVETVALIMSELATNAVLASITDAQAMTEGISKDAVVGAQLRAIEASLFVEVYDRTSAVPVRRNPDQDAEGGRGLLLVDVLAKQWNVYRPSVGGKIVWAELPLGFPLEPSACTYEHTPLILPRGLRATYSEDEHQARRALLDRLLTTTILADTAARMTDAL